MEKSEIVHVLEESEIFGALDKRDIQKIAGLCKVLTFEPGEYVFRQGDLGEDLYVIAEGRMLLERSVDLGSRKGSVVTGFLGKGRVFGCWSSLLGEPHDLMSSATSSKRTKVVMMKGAGLREMMLRDRDLGFSILQRLCFLLRDRIRGVYTAMEKI